MPRAPRFAPETMALSSWALSPALRLCAAGPACSWEMLHVAGAGTVPSFCALFPRGVGLDLQGGTS